MNEIFLQEAHSSGECCFQDQGSGRFGGGLTREMESCRLRPTVFPDTASRDRVNEIDFSEPGTVLFT